MNLSTLDRLKTALGGNVSSEQDAFLTSLIRAVSARVETYLGRDVEIRERTEVLDVENGQRLFSLSAYPIEQVLDVRFDTTHQFGDDTLVDETAYFVDMERGVLIFQPRVLALEPSLLTSYFSALSVTYEGGMGAIDGTDGETSEDFIATYPDIAHAVDAQCVEMYRRKDRQGATNFSVGEGATAFEGPLSLLKIVREILDPHRRTLAR